MADRRSDCDPSFFPGYLSNKFKRVLRESKPGAAHPQLAQVHKKLNVCSNIAVKRYVVLFEELSRKFAHRSSRFSWRACFDIQTPPGFCPDKLRHALGQLPKDKDALVDILNAKHYIELKPAKLLLHVLSLVGNALDNAFDRRVLEQHTDLGLVRLER